MAAAAASCSSDLAGTTTAPQSRANVMTIANTTGSTWSSTLTTHGAMVNKPACPAAQPEFSVPVIGWPPTNRSRRPAAVTASSTAPLTLVTSVSGHPGANSLMRASIPGTAGMGTASTINAPVSAARFSVSVSSIDASKPSARAPWALSTERL